MAEKSSFFNSIAGDRMYQASDFASYFNSLITNGVFPNPSTNLQIISNDDMTATVKVGKAWINGYVYINDSDLILPIEVADGILNRIDRIVIRFDTVGRLISTVVKKGTFASSPVAPTLVRDADFYELGIADIYIVNGATSIVQGDITDLRMNTELCGWVNSLIQADTTAIFDQYQDWFTTQSGTYNDEMIASETQFETDFNTWFTDVKEVLGVDVAANLLVKIDDNTAALATHSADYTRNPGYAVDTGVANAYVVTLNPAPTAYVDGMRVMVKIVHSNTLTTCTLNVNGLGVKTLYKAIGTLFIGDIQINNMYELIYSAALGAFMLVGGDLDAIKLGGVAASGYATAAQGTKADNAIPLSQKGTVGGVASYDAVATSLAENTQEHGDLTLLNTVDKTSIVNSVNELFTDVDNGKNTVYSAIVGKGSTPISEDFTDLVTGINNIVSSSVKTVQRGATDIASVTFKDVIISPIDVNTSIVTIIVPYLLSTPDKAMCSIEIINSTTIRIHRNTIDTGSYSPSWQVVEFNGVKSLQKGIATTSPTILSVNMAKSMVFDSVTTTSTSANIICLNYSARLILNNNLALSGSNKTHYWQLIEFN